MEFSHNIKQVSINRLLRRDAVQIFCKYSRYVLLLASTLVIAYGSKLVIEQLLSASSKSTTIQNEIAAKIVQINKPVEQKNILPTDYKDVASQQIFGVLTGGQPRPTPPPPPTKTISDLNLTLIGTMTFNDKGTAIIASKKDGNKQQAFAVNDPVFETATLSAIFPDKVELDLGGRKEFLFLDEGISSSSSSSGDDSSGNDVVVDEAELDKALSNLPVLLQQARAVPFFKDGKSIGLRLFAIRSGSLYEKIGLMNGDILKELNGTNLGDVSQAIKLFERLKEEKDITLKLERGREDKVIHYTIR